MQSSVPEPKPLLSIKVCHNFVLLVLILFLWHDHRWIFCQIKEGGCETIRVGGNFFPKRIFTYGHDNNFYEQIFTNYPTTFELQVSSNVNLKKESHLISACFKTLFCKYTGLSA